MYSSKKGKRTDFREMTLRGLLLLLLLPVGSLTALAGPGPFITTYGGRYFGLGGTHIALGGSVMDLQANPAMLLALPGGRFEMGGPVIFGTLNYIDDFNSLDNVNPGLSFENDLDSKTIAVIPYMGFASPINDHMAWGIVAYAQAGGGVDIDGIVSILPVEGTPGQDAPIPLRFVRTVQNQFLGAYFFKLTPGFAYRLGPLSVGIGVDAIYGSQTSEQTFYDETTGEELLNLEYTGDNVIAFGGKVGATLEIIKGVKIAYAYMLRNRFDFDGEFVQTDQGVEEVAQVQNTFRIPDRHTVGLSLSLGDFTFAADGNLVRYAAFYTTRYLELTEPLFPGGATVSKTLLNYKDQLFGSAGLEYKPNKVAYRIGWHYGKSPIREWVVSPSENFIAEHHGQVGLGFDIGRFNYNVALEIAFPSSYEGEPRTDWGNQRFFSQTDTYEVTLSQRIFYFSVAYKM